VTKSKNIELIKAFGEHIRNLRIERSMTQLELAAEANIPLSQIGRIEQGDGNVTLSTLYNIAVAFNLTLSELLAFYKKIQSNKG